jgi:DNA mismatch endonuclease, patch repair protein
MADVFSKRMRSEIMSRVKGSGNKATEKRFATILRRHRIVGWRRRYPLFGRPDFVFPTRRISVFLDGCFWHGCPTHWSCPTTNRQFWQRKVERNKERDRLVNRKLKMLGWQVVRFWQHELSDAPRVARRLMRALCLIPLCCQVLPHMKKKDYKGAK